MPQVTMPDGSIVDMPDTLTPELAIRLKSVQGKSQQSQQPPAGSTAMPPNRAMLDMSGNTQSTPSQPSAPQGMSGKVMDWIHRQGQGVADVAKYANDVWHTPQKAVAKYVDAAMSGIGVLSPEHAERLKNDLQQWQEQKEQHRANVWGPGAFLTDIAANPLTYAMGPESAEATAATEATSAAPRIAEAATLPKSGEAAKEGIETLTKVPGLGRKVAQGAVQGNVMSTLDPNASPVSVGVGTVGGAALPLATEAAAPLARGASNMIKGLWGESTTPTVEDVLPHFANRFKGQAGDMFKRDLQHNYATDRAVAGIPFQELRANGGDVPLPKLESGLDDTITKLENSRSGKDEVALSKLRSLQEGLKNPDAPHDWGSALDVGTDINAMLSDAKHGMVPNHNLARVVGPLKGLLSDDMDTAGAASGQAYQKAKQGWVQKVVPWEDPEQGGKVLQSFMRNPNPNDAMKALTLAGPDKAKMLVARSGPKGVQALQSGIAETAMEDAAHPVTGQAVPSRILKSLNDRENLYNLVFTGEDKAKMDGYKKILQVSSFADSVLPGKWGISASQAAQKLFSTEAGTDFLLGASKLNPQGRYFGQFVTANAPKVFGTASAKLMSRQPRNTPYTQEPTQP